MVFRKTKINIQAPFATLSTEKKKSKYFMQKLRMMNNINIEIIITSFHNQNVIWTFMLIKKQKF